MYDIPFFFFKVGFVNFGSKQLLQQIKIDETQSHSYDTDFTQIKCKKGEVNFFFNWKWLIH